MAVRGAHIIQKGLSGKVMCAAMHHAIHDVKHQLAEGMLCLGIPVERHCKPVPLNAGYRIQHGRIHHVQA